MTLVRFAAENFRCLAAIEMEVEPGFNVIFGGNASGKTSLLEAVGYLGRGKSFRGVPAGDLIRYGTEALTLVGRVRRDSRTISLGVKNSRAEGLEVRIDGARGGNAAGLAAALPLQILDPDVHDLVAGGPDGRRRFLDWIAFHVEPAYLGIWRRFRRALRQRNAALRAGAATAEIEGWSAEFAGVAEELDAGRRRALALAAGHLEQMAGTLLGTGVVFDYQRGWPAGGSLAEALEEAVDRDRQLGGTRLGPHRAELRVVQEQRKARGIVSRGQQKLLASAMVLAATATVQEALERPLLLLLDDPAAELDRQSLARLTAMIAGLGSQVLATSLQPDDLDFGADVAVFHVEQGAIRQLG